MENSNRKLKNILPWAGMIILLFLIIGIGTGVDVYKGQRPSRLSSAVISFIPYPAAIVNGGIVTLNDLEKNVKTLEYYYKNTKEVGINLMPADFDKKAIKRAVLNHLIEDKIVSQLLKEYNLKVTDKELENQLQETIALVGDKNEMISEIKDLFGWRLDDFKEKSLLPSLKYKKLKESWEAEVLGDKSKSKSFEDWLQRQKEKAEVKVLVRGMRWEKGKIK